MAHDGRLAIEPSDDLFEVVRDLADALPGERVRLRIRLLDALGVVRPARRERGVSGFVVDRRPPLPAAWKQPKSVDENDWRTAGRVRLLDLLVLVLDDRGH